MICCFDVIGLGVDISFKIAQKDCLMQSMDLVRNRELDGVENDLSFLDVVVLMLRLLELFGMHVCKIAFVALRITIGI
jgi:hypothetical protein